jgi:hypothetical protein
MPVLYKNTVTDYCLHATKFLCRLPQFEDQLYEGRKPERATRHRHGHSHAVSQHGHIHGQVGHRCISGATNTCDLRCAPVNTLLRRAPRAIDRAVDLENPRETFIF